MESKQTVNLRKLISEITECTTQDEVVESTETSGPSALQSHYRPTPSTTFPHLTLPSHSLHYIPMCKSSHWGQVLIDSIYAF
jgi:hypothetical protein